MFVTLHDVNMSKLIICTQGDIRGILDNAVIETRSGRGLNADISFDTAGESCSISNGFCAAKEKVMISIAGSWVTLNRADFSWIEIK